MEKMPGEKAIDRSEKELSKPDDGISFSEKSELAKVKSLSCKEKILEL